MSRWENGALDLLSVTELEGWATALGAHLVLDLKVDGERPLIDARHARLQARFAELLRQMGWLVSTEVSLNHYGDHGRVDVLAFHPATRILLVIEIKSRLDDLQDTLGVLDVKPRVAPTIATAEGWNPVEVVAALVVAEGSTARRRIAGHAALFSRYTLRGKQAAEWLRHPGPPAPEGILMVVAPPT